MLKSIKCSKRGGQTGAPSDNTSGAITVTQAVHTVTGEGAAAVARVCLGGGLRQFPAQPVGYKLNVTVGTTNANNLHVTCEV